MAGGVGFWPFWAGWAWIVVVAGASVAFRVRRGKPIMPKPPADARFLARRASGRSLDTPWGRIGGARNALMVVVTEDTLWVTPAFPFTLLFLPEIYGLEHRVPLHAITGVERRRGLVGETVTLSFTTDRPHRLELRVGRTGALVAALAERPRP